MDGGRGRLRMTRMASAGSHQLPALPYAFVGREGLVQRGAAGPWAVGSSGNVQQRNICNAG